MRNATKIGSGCSKYRKIKYLYYWSAAVTQPLGVHQDYGRFYFKLNFYKKIQRPFFHKTAGKVDIKKA